MGFKEYIKQVQNANRNMPKATKIIYGTIALIIAFAVLQKIVFNPTIFIIIAALYVGVVFHEVAHGYAAYYNGDPTAKIWRRLTLNPAKHIDPIGTLVPVVLILLGSPFVIGWAKPVPINYSMLKNKKKGLFMVAIAGVLVNLLNVFVASTILKFFPKEEITQVLPEILSFNRISSFNIQNIIIAFLFYVIIINLALAIFNLIPIPPLDGSRIIEAFGNAKTKKFLNSMEKYGFIVILVLLWLGILGSVILPIMNGGLNIVLTYIGIY